VQKANKILVIGGFGFFGQKIVESLQRLPNADIVIGVRKSNENPKTLQIDLEDASELKKLKTFDFVINTITVEDNKYKHLVYYCLTNKVRFIETTADFEANKLLFAIKTAIKDEIEKEEINGSFVFGAGIFPGVSNLVYKRHLEKYTVNNSINLNVRYKVLSGAGKGMIALMIKGISTPCFWFERADLISKKVPFGSMQKQSFNSGNHSSVQITLPEILFINAHSKISNIKTFISFQPTFITIISYYFFNLIPYLGFLKKAFLKLLYVGFYIVRGVFFKNTDTDIYISCQNDDNHVSGIWLNDAFLSAGLFLAAIITFYQETDNNKGMLNVEDTFDLETVVQRMVEIGKSDLKYQYF
jgi:saccharopine dehydrogenase-like NADP-dependent oxidoreductase